MANTGYAQQQLTPEMLKAAYAAGFINPDGTLNIAAAQAYQGNADGKSYAGSLGANPLYKQGTGGLDANGIWQPGEITGWRTSADQGAGAGREDYSYRPYDEWDASGKRTGGGNYEDIRKTTVGKDLAIAAAAVLSAGAAGGMFAGAGLSGIGTGAGGVGSAGTGLSELGLAGEGAFGTTNALGGAGAFGPAGTAYYTGTGALTAAGAGGATGSGVGGSSLLGGTGGAGGAAGGSSLLSGLGSGGVGSLIGPAATVLGAVAGSKGNEQGANSERRMDPRLDGAVYGEGGIVPRTQGLLAQQMTPEAQAGWLQMQQQGKGLLSQPIAGNGFQQFANRRLM